MISENIAYISNYFWKVSIDNVNTILSDDQIRSFNLNDYYYLTVISQLGSPNLGDVARELKLTKPAISVMVQRLIKNDLVEKLRSSEDKRVYYLVLTEKGNKIIQGDYALYNNLSDEIVKLLSKEQLYDIEGLLTILVNQLKERQSRKE